MPLESLKVKISLMVFITGKKTKIIESLRLKGLLFYFYEFDSDLAMLFQPIIVK